MNTPDETKPLDPNTLPPKLKALYEAAKKLAQIEHRREMWKNLAKALEKTETPAKPDCPTT